MNLEENLIAIQNDLIWKSYQTGEYRTFYVYEPKKRLVAALPFRDRVVHHALCNVIEPIFDARFIFDSYACRYNKGTHKGTDRAQEYMRRVNRKGRLYCLKGDVAKYFPNIDHGVLKELLRKRISCKDTIWLCDEIINSARALNDGTPKGIPIGNLTSQLFANVYLHELDVFVKHDLKERYYVRYMDDFVVFRNDKKQLHQIRKSISVFLETKLMLRLNGKTQVFPVKRRGVDFLGYRSWPTHRLLRKPSRVRIERKLRAFEVGYKKGSVTAMPKLIFPWIGGKRKLAENILPLFPDHQCYVEPFCGAAALFFLKRPSEVEVLNDINGEIVNLFRIVKYHLEELYRQFKWVLTSRQNWEWLKITPSETLTDVQRAARFLYLQKLAFGAKVDGQAFGTATTSRPRFNIFTLEQDLADAHFRLTGTTLEHLHWTEAVSKYDRPHTLFYCDPPYWQTEGYGVEFGWDQYENLVRVAHAIKGQMIISINDHPDIRGLFDGFPSIEIDYRYTIGGKGGQFDCKELVYGTWPDGVPEPRESQITFFDVF